MMKLVFWNVFRSLLIKICCSCLLNKQKYMPTNFWQQILIGNHDPKLEVGWIKTMKTLIGLLILQGIEQKPENGIYFSKRESTVTPYFSQIMTEKRFHILLKFLPFAGNSKFDPDQQHKKLYKIQLILDHLKFNVFLHWNKISLSTSLSSSGKDRVGFNTYHQSEAVSE